MKCKNCSADITYDDITMNVNDTDIELILECPVCNVDYGLFIDNSDLHEL